MKGGGLPSVGYRLEKSVLVVVPDAEPQVAAFDLRRLHCRGECH
jgi:hypothetical protein